MASGDTGFWCLLGLLRGFWRLLELLVSGATGFLSYWLLELLASGATGFWSYWLMAASGAMVFWRLYFTDF